jgi:hypothetical protein
MRAAERGSETFLRTAETPVSVLAAGFRRSAQGVILSEAKDLARGPREALRGECSVTPRARHT